MPAPVPTDATLAAQGTQLVGDLRAVFGKHHARAVHAKGIILEGSFTPAPEANGLCKAVIFAGSVVPVTIRFSDFTGIPEIPDNTGDANPRGFGVKFQAADKSQYDIVAHSFDGFPVATAADFGVLMRAIAASGPTAAKPTDLDRFLEARPAAKTFLTTQKSPASFATAAYFGVNAIALTNAGGERRVVRYRFIPKAGEQYLDGAALGSKGPNYLREEITARVAAAPVRFDWFVQIAEPGDKLDDPSLSWPAGRKQALLGTITADRLTADQAARDRSLSFMPGMMLDGMEAADPMLAIRDAAYSVSFGERQ